MGGLAGNLYPPKNRGVGGKTVQEEQGPLKMFQPVAAPAESGIMADDRQNYERPKKQERLTRRGAANAKRTGQSTDVFAGQNTQ